jgi:hypothetical protein
MTAPDRSAHTKSPLLRRGRPHITFNTLDLRSRGPKSDTSVGLLHLILLTSARRRTADSATRAIKASFSLASLAAASGALSCRNPCSGRRARVRRRLLWKKSAAEKLGSKRRSYHLPTVPCRTLTSAFILIRTDHFIGSMAPTVNILDRVIGDVVAADITNPPANITSI